MNGVLAGALPAVPLLVALVGLLLPLRARRTAAALGIAGAAVALADAVALAARVKSPTTGGWRLVDFGGGLVVHVSYLLTPAAAVVAVAVGTVALAVQVYSVSYLHDDGRYPPYAAQVSLFTAAMLLVVVSGDLILLLVGWEVMGICSYLLIGHDRTLPEAGVGGTGWRTAVGDGPDDPRATVPAGALGMKSNRRPPSVAAGSSRCGLRPGRRTR